MKVVRELIALVRLIKDEEPSLNEIMTKLDISRATAFRHLKSLNTLFGVNISLQSGAYKINDFGIFSPYGLNLWTPDNDAFLRENYQLNSARVTADLMGRTVSAVQMRASKIRVAKKGKGEERQDHWKKIVWTNSEDEIIHKNYPLLGSKVISLLPGRTALSIYVRARELKVRRDFSLNKS